MNEPSKLLHQISEVQRAIGVGRTTVYGLISEHQLDVVHIGRRALVTDESLRAYVARLRDAA